MGPFTIGFDSASPPRLFVGAFPGGMVYADRQREEHGDYKRLAFLPWHTLVLEVERDCPATLRAEIVADAALIQARRGDAYPVSACGQTVRLGSRIIDGEG